MCTRGFELLHARDKKKRAQTDSRFLGWTWLPRYEPLLSDFFIVADKLEKLGFRYFQGRVTVFKEEDL